jgi:hypothetical protein
MKDAKDEFFEKKMQMWKRREELLNSMSEKELRAFIKGYMMAERMVFKQLSSMCGCQGGSCQEGSSCKSESCGCEEKDCHCDKE